MCCLYLEDGASLINNECAPGWVFSWHSHFLGKRVDFGVFGQKWSKTPKMVKKGVKMAIFGTPKKGVKNGLFGWYMSIFALLFWEGFQV